jgi:hypothetical protein
VTVQFLAQDNSSTNCWQTTFSGPALVNTTAQFKAKGP